MKKIMIAALAVCVLGQSAFAQFDLRVTESWSGNEPGSNQTDDWFELTNVGDTAWTTADGLLYFDDDSVDETTADVLSGVTSIAPGESVIFVDGDDSEWITLWNPVIGTLPQVGTYGGAGLSQGGDGVAIFLDSASDGVDAADLIAFRRYPDADSNGGESYDYPQEDFSSNVSYAVTTIGVNDEGQPSIGSPGYIPEPGTIALAVLGMIGVLNVRRK